MKVLQYPKRDVWKELTERPNVDTLALAAVVDPIIQSVRKEGDIALIEFAKKFDDVELKEIKVSEEEIDKAEKLVDDELKRAIATAYENIYKFHASQLEESRAIETMPGVTCWRRAVPIESVGLYVPGGSAPLFSTVLMLGIPAQIAGCKNIALCTPCNKAGVVNPAILYTAKKIGISSIFKIGGAQAIAAFAFGTETIPKVDKIFGPGNQYVTGAKQAVNNSGVAIDMPAGPSEVLVIGDEYANPAFIAADLLSQAEHGPDSQVVFVSLSEALLEGVQSQIDIQIKQLPRKNIAQRALDNSLAIVVNTLEEALDFSNLYAPEHLILAIKTPEKSINKIINAGSVFLGNYTPEAAGDYASGTNHTLPTNGYATAYSGVSLDSFMKKITFQKITKEGIQQIGKTIETMAEAEELMAHKNAVTLRLTSN